MRASGSGTGLSGTSPITWWLMATVAAGWAVAAACHEAPGPTPEPAPATPTGLQASPGPSAREITLVWDSVSGATSYNLYWSNSAGDPQAQRVSGVRSPWRMTGLQAGTTYYFSVVATDVGVESPRSTEVAAKAVDIGVAVLYPADGRLTGYDLDLVVQVTSARQVASVKATIPGLAPAALTYAANDPPWSLRSRLRSAARRPGHA